MNLDKHPEREALVESAGRLVREQLDYPTVRATIAGERGYDPSLWAQFAELGWLAAGLSEAAGGLGLAPSVLSALATALGPAAMSEPLLGQLGRAGVVLEHLPVSSARDALAESWLSGEVLLAVIDARDDGVAATRGEGGGWSLHGRASAVIDGGVASHFAVVVAQGEQLAVHVLERDNTGVAIESHRAADGRSMADIDFTAAAVLEDMSFEGLPAALMDALTARYALLLASESLGIMATLHGLTAAYLAEREQFGSRLIEFQALQHRLVDMQLACVRAESMLELARFEFDTRGLGAAAPLISATKAVVGTCGREVGQEAVQLHGGIGMTEELVVGHYLKRLIANEMLGGHTAWHLQRCARARGLACA